MATIPRPEHPRPDLFRPDWINLNGTWDFEIDNDQAGVKKKFFNKTSLDSKIIVPFSPESKLSGVGNTDFMNMLWYRRNIEIPKEWDGKNVLLHIGGCDYQTTLYVNEKMVGTHKGGYISFTFNITEYLKASDNYITICVEDDIQSGNQFSGKQSKQPESYACFYTRTTGIWQTVWLEAVEKCHVTGYKIYSNISKSCIDIDVNCSYAKDAKCTIKAYYDKKPVGKTEFKINGLSGKVTLPLSEVHLWELGNGRLYDLEITLEENGKVDRVQGYFGLREVSLSKKKGLQINGKTVFGRFVLDQGFYPDGIITAPSDEALIFDIKAAMDCGFNGARLHQKVFEPRFLYHADRMGYMVWGESGDWGFNATSLSNLNNCLPEWLEAVDRDFSHPSVIGWCPFNEVGDVDGVQISTELLDTVYDITKKIDPTRPCITASGTWPTQRTDVHDVHDYTQDPEQFKDNYSHMDEGYIKDYLWRRDPQRQVAKVHLPIFVSEYGGIKWVADDPESGWGYGQSVTTPEEFMARLKGLTDVLLNHGDIFAFCYTQLTDVEQEKNGLLTYDRKFKFPAEQYREIFSRKSVIED